MKSHVMQFRAVGVLMASAGLACEDHSASWTPVFETRVLTRDFFAEGAAIGDIDGDGRDDLVGGPYWYAAPGYERAGQLHAQPAIAVEELSTHFLTYLDDLNADGALDVIAIGLGGADARWYENPRTGDWPVHTLALAVGSESPLYLDVVGDERRELIYLSQGRFGYAERGVEPTQVWTFHPISPELGLSPFTHGLGAGDVDGDGRTDLLEQGGWWQQPATLGQDWVRHAVDFSLGKGGGAQMLVFDVDGDGDQDVVTSLQGHGYGLFWFEQRASAFVAHEILSADPTPDNVSQLHALASADLNGDGLLDVITGKRFYAHPPPMDPGGSDPALLLWFELQRSPQGATFVRHLIDDDSGVGCNFAVKDVNADGKPDIFTSSKKGSILHLQR